MGNSPSSAKRPAEPAAGIPASPTAGPDTDTAAAPPSPSTCSRSEPAQLKALQGQVGEAARAGSLRKIKVGILALGAFAVIFVGVNTGAFLRRDSRASEERKKLEAAPEELISVLDSRRRALVREREKLQRKLDLFAHGKHVERQDMRRRP